MAPQRDVSNLLRREVTSGIWPPSVSLVALLGPRFPAVDTIAPYRWIVRVAGDERFRKIRDVRVALELAEGAKAAIVDLVPRREIADVGSLSLEGIPGIKVTLPFRPERVVGTISSARQALWRFRDISLLADTQRSLTISGIASIAIFPGADINRLDLRLSITTHFAGGLWAHREVPLGPEMIIPNLRSILPRGTVVRTVGLIERGKYETFEYESGKLMKGGVRNVSLRVRTFHMMFDRLLRAQPGVNVGSTLHNLGAEVGEQFMLEFGKHIDSDERAVRLLSSDDPILRARSFLTLWADYDSWAGWGEFTNEALDLEEGHVTIQVRNSFLMNGISDEFPVCEYMAGYIEGVLGVATGHDYQVTDHKHWQSGGEWCCSFECKRIDGSS